MKLMSRHGYKEMGWSVYMVSLKLVIDNREPELILGGFSEIDGVSVERANLKHGDFEIRGGGAGVGPEEDRVLIVVERKSLADLLASVDDGRYRQQKRALLDAYDRRMVYYVIETGVWLDGFYSSVRCSETAIGCIVGTMVRDDIKVFFTKDAADTVGLIRGMLKRFTKNYDKYFGGVSGGDGSGGGDVGTCAFVEKTKKRDPGARGGNIFVSMLMMIPGINEKTAVAIGDRYKGFKELGVAIDVAGGAVAFRDACLVNGRRMAQKTVDLLCEVCKA
jgi:ERCC4-type nuclease